MSSLLRSSWWTVPVPTSLPVLMFRLPVPLLLTGCDPVVTMALSSLPFHSVFVSSTGGPATQYTYIWD